MHVWQSLAAHIRAGGRGLRFPPVILDGPPGVGKTHFARRLAAHAGTTCRVIDAGAASAAFRIAGVERGWSTEAPGIPVQEMLATGITNPVIVVDEIDKAAEAEFSGSGFRTSLVAALLGLLEPDSAKGWECLCFRLTFDMSRICWVLTSNDAAGLMGEERAELLEREARSRLRPGQLSLRTVRRLVEAVASIDPVRRIH